MCECFSDMMKWVFCFFQTNMLKYLLLQGKTSTVEILEGIEKVN